MTNDVSDLDHLVIGLKWLHFKQNVCCEFSGWCCTNFASESWFICHLGFEYAGLQIGYECRCGTAFPTKAIRLFDDRCNVSCPANKSEMCGAVEAVSVYRTGVGSEYLTLIICSFWTMFPLPLLSCGVKDKQTYRLTGRQTGRQTATGVCDRCMCCG